MSNFLIRNLDDGVRAALQLRAERNARSLSAEVREILSEATKENPPANALEMIDAIFPPALRLTAAECSAFGKADHKSDAPDLS
ncbi:MAG: hypothetical protein R3D03_20820 [Geminicoccaceae bacterium]|nr:hypothetical protein [Anaerolineae bacterium]MCB1970327.1 hypothetical protein [Geminicoccaceae bacterium]